ncbi:YbaK/EbsC family protein [Microbacterium istanbulense]|uniref:YbaK/EbsC family protein n=1 Tax=Microbacterium istanbulense TaxID=3122049 RepID=A0ABU8LMN8_9MICO
MTAPESLPARSRIVHDHLVAAGVETQVVVLPDSARTAVEAAAAVGCDVGAIANSLVLTADDAPVLVMTSGAHRVDFAVLAESLGAAAVAMAPAALVREVTGQAIGGVAPVGHPAPLPTYLDQDLQNYEQIWAAAGTPHSVMPLTFAQLEKLTAGAIVRVA